MRHPGHHEVRVTPPLEHKLLDAALDELSDRPWADISMLQIASRAGVGRTRLYQEFGSRHDFERALIAREVGSLLAATEQALTENRREPTRALAVVAEAFLASASERPLLAKLACQEIQRDEPPSGEPKPSVDSAVSRLRGLITQTWPSIRHIEAELVSEALVRLAISHVLWPSARTEVDGESVAQVLGVYLNKVLGMEQPEPASPLPTDGPELQSTGDPRVPLESSESRS